MKNSVLIAMLFLCGNAFSQIYVPVVPAPYGENVNRIKPFYVQHLPEKDSTLNTADTTAQIFYRKLDSTLWVWSKAKGYFKVGKGNLDSLLMQSKYEALVDSIALATGINLKANINSPILTGVPESTTPPLNDSSTKIATTAFNARALKGKVNYTDSSGGMAGEFNIGIVNSTNTAVHFTSPFLGYGPTYTNNFINFGEDNAEGAAGSYSVSMYRSENTSQLISIQRRLGRNGIPDTVFYRLRTAYFGTGSYYFKAVARYNKKPNASQIFILHDNYLNTNTNITSDFNNEVASAMDGAAFLAAYIASPGYSFTTDAGIAGTTGDRFYVLVYEAKPIYVTPYYFDTHVPTGGAGGSGISEFVSGYGLVNTNDSTARVDSTEMVNKAFLTAWNNIYGSKWTDVTGGIVRATGNVMIGTSTDNGSKLQVVSTGEQLNLKYDASNHVGLKTTNLADLEFYTNGNLRGKFSNGRWFGKQYGEYDLTTFGGNDNTNSGLGIDGANGSASIIVGTRKLIALGTGEILINKTIGDGFTKLNIQGSVLADSFKVAGSNSDSLLQGDGSRIAKSTFLTSLSGAVLTNQASPQTIGLTGSRLTKLWATDIEVTNAIAGSITGNSGTVTNGVYTTGSYSNPAWLTDLAWSKITGTPTLMSGYGITTNVKDTIAKMITDSLAAQEAVLGIGLTLVKKSVSLAPTDSIKVNLATTDSSARKALSVTGAGGSYNDVTGVFTLTGGSTALYGLITDTVLNTIKAGKNALKVNSGSNNIAIGGESLQANTTGGFNMAIGPFSLEQNIDGANNVGVGGYTFKNATSPEQSVAIGDQAAYNVSNGQANVAIGYKAYFNGTIGSNNTVTGQDAGRFLADGVTALVLLDNSVFIGKGTKASVNNVTNETVIGYNAIGNGSNTFTHGNTSIVGQYLPGQLFMAGYGTGSTYTGTAIKNLSVTAAGAVIVTDAPSSTGQTFQQTLATSALRIF